MKKQRMIILLKTAGLLIGLSAGLLACGTAKTGSTDIQETEKASAVAESNNEKYARATDPAKQTARYVFNGKVKTGVTSAVADVSNQFGQGNLKNTDEMVEALQKRLDEMQ